MREWLLRLRGTERELCPERERERERELPSSPPQNFEYKPLQQRMATTSVKRLRELRSIARTHQTVWPKGRC